MNAQPTSLLLVCACVVLPVAAWAQPSAGFTPSRTSGVAPLAVFFDGSSSTCSGCADVDDPWHDLAYAWDFDDASAGTWSTSGLSKATDIGPSAAHVFETAGQYVVHLTVRDPGTGQWSVMTRTITVTDPGALATFCYAATFAGSFSGCPAGAAQKTMSSFSGAIADCEGAGHRCLFRRGDIFTTSSTVKLDGSAPAIIGAFGSGAKPLVDASGLGGGTLFLGTTGGKDYRVMDLLLKGAGVTNSQIYGADHVQSDVLFLRVDGVPSTWHMFMETSQTQLAQGGFLQHIFAVECTMKRVGFGGGGNILYLSWQASAVLGNDFEDTRNGEHIIRAAQYDDLLIAHNVLGGANSGKHVVTLRSADAAAPCTAACAPSKKGHIHANVIFESDPYAVQVCGHVQSQTQQCEDTLVEGNFAFASPSYPLAAPQTVIFHLADQTTTRTTFRNNICNLSNAAGACVYLKVSSLARAVNNTCYRKDGRDLTCLQVLGGGPGSAPSIARNNLGWSTGGAVTMISGAFKTSDHNVHATSNPFATASPGTSAADYRLVAGSPAVNAGTGVPSLFDFGEHVRPAGGAYDVGAWELGAGAITGPGGGGTTGSGGGAAGSVGGGTSGAGGGEATGAGGGEATGAGGGEAASAGGGEAASAGGGEAASAGGGKAASAGGGEAAGSSSGASAPSSTDTLDMVHGGCGCSTASGDGAAIAAVLLALRRRRGSAQSVTAFRKTVHPERLPTGCVRRTLISSAAVLSIAACTGVTDGTTSVGASEPGGSAGGAGTSEPDSGGGAPTPPSLTSDEQVVLSARPYRLVVPTDYDGSSPVPLMLLLHGYGSSGSGADTYFAMSALAQARGFLLATPNGEKDVFGLRYWNATDYCCGTTFDSKPDDVAYLTAILDDVRLKYRVDEKRVFVVGHSNGGFMSHRMACDRADRVAAIVSLAGAQWKDLSNCTATGAVSVLEVHGDADFVVQYGGTSQYPGALETTQDWATLNPCATSTSSAGGDLDLTTDSAGAETTRVRHDGCPIGRGVELWTIHGGQHMPAFNAIWASTVYDFLMAHPKP